MKFLNIKKANLVVASIGVADVFYWGYRYAGERLDLGSLPFFLWNTSPFLIALALTLWLARLEFLLSLLTAQVVILILSVLAFGAPFFSNTHDAQEGLIFLFLPLTLYPVALFVFGAGLVLFWVFGRFFR